MSAKDSLAAGAKYWICGVCGAGNSGTLLKCLCGWARGSSNPSPGVKVTVEGNRKLRKHRGPNATEAAFGLILEARLRAREIVSYDFEGVTLRWADMSYTPDYFVIQRSVAQLPMLGGPGARGDAEVDLSMCQNMRPPTVYSIEAVYIELKGGHKWEDSIVKFKAARDRFKWARFEMWQRVKGRWEQIA